MVRPARDLTIPRFRPDLLTKTIPSKQNPRPRVTQPTHHQATAIKPINMKSIISLVAVTALFAATNVVALDRTLQGCFSSSTGMVFNASIEFNSRGSCGDACYALDYPVMAMTNSSYCFCSQTLPPASTKASNSKCTIECPGFGSEVCK